jgi:hypothetical protein
MDKKPEALRLADSADACQITVYDCALIAAELRRLNHNNEVLMNALWKSCGDNEETVNATIESQGELK